MSDNHSDEGDDESALDGELDRAVPNESPAAYLMLMTGGRPGRVFPVARNTVVIGRAPGVDIRIDDLSVSARHARIVADSVGYLIEDLGSTNGVFVGTTKVNRARLKNRERLRVGGIDFVFMMERETDATIAVVSQQDEGGGALVPAYAPYDPRPRSRPAAAPFANARKDDDDDDEKGPDLKAMILKAVKVGRFFRRYALLIFVSTSLTTAAGLASIRLRPPPPSASSEIRLMPEPMLNPMDPGARSQMSESSNFFTDAERAFTNPDLVRTTLKALGEPDPDKLRVQSLAASLRLEPIGSNLYMAKFGQGAWSDKPDSVSFLKTQIETYVGDAIARKLKVLTEEAKFLRGQLAEIGGKLSGVNTDMVKFKEANVDRLPEQATASIGARISMETRRTDVVALVNRLEGELQNARRQLAADNPISASRLVQSDPYRVAQADLNRKLGEARARGLGDAHPEIRKLLDEKRSLDILVQQQLSAGTSAVERRSNPALQALETQSESLSVQLRSAKVELAELDRGLSHVRGVVRELPRVDVKIKEMTHEQGSLERFRATLFERLKQTELQLEIERVSVQARFEVVSPPTLEGSKRNKNIATRGGIGLAVGLFIAASIIALREGRRILKETLADEVEPA